MFRVSCMQDCQNDLTSGTMEKFTFSVEHQKYRHLKLVYFMISKKGNCVI